MKLLKIQLDDLFSTYIQDALKKMRTQFIM